MSDAPVARSAVTADPPRARAALPVPVTPPAPVPASSPVADQLARIEDKASRNEDKYARSEALLSRVEDRWGMPPSA